MGSIYYIPNLFFFEYDLCKIDQLRAIIKAMEILSLDLAIVIFICHFDDNLEEFEKCNIDTAKYITDLIAW